MPRCTYRFALAIAVLAVAARPAGAQESTTTYHLHKEPSTTSGVLQLKTAGPDARRLAYRTANLRNQPPGSATIRTFLTEAGVPDLRGVIPAGSTIAFTIWMKKTTTAGMVFPQASIGLNFPVTASLCQGTGSTALTTTLEAYTFSCTTASPIAMGSADRVVVEAGYSMAVGPGARNLRVALHIEGRLSAAADSRVVAPNPVASVITSLTPNSGPPGTSVTIGGTNFGPTQATSTVTFNGAMATPTGWSNTSITVPVPPGATSGPVVVTVGGAASAGTIFTVTPLPSITSLTPSTGVVGDLVTIAGANFGATQGTSGVSFNSSNATPTTWSDTSIDVPVPAGATSGPVVVTVSGAPSNGLAFTVQAATGSQLEITSPANGAVVSPGQDLSVTVSSPDNAPFTMVAVFAGGGIGFSDAATSVPATFTLAIPPDMVPRTYLLTAVARTSSGQSTFATIGIDVERADLPLLIEAPMPLIDFKAQGEESRVSIQAEFADGAILDVTESSNVTYVSSDPDVATVDDSGNVTATAEGTATITATYSASGQNLQAEVTVIVPLPVFAVEPNALDFGDQAVGTFSAQQLTLTNSTSGPLSIDSVAATGDFSATDNCVSASPLAAGATCTITVTFGPAQTGLRIGAVGIASTFNLVPVSFGLRGTGISP